MSEQKAGQRACTLPPPLPAPARVVVPPPALLAAFATVPASRRRARSASALAALLALAVTAMLANPHCPLASAAWAARQGAAVLGPLGCAAGRPPCHM